MYTDNMIYGVTILGLTGLAGLTVAVVLVLIFLFELAMLISVLRNRHLSSNRIILWVIGMLLLHPFVAIAYYFTDRKSSTL